MDNIREALKGMSAEDRRKLLDDLKKEERQAAQQRRESYEALRASFMLDVKNKLMPVVEEVKGFRVWIEAETEAFRGVMREYGQLRKEEQLSFTLVDGDLKVEVRSNNVKTFDERADMAAERLVEYLKSWVSRSEKGQDDPMYQLAMTLLERNKQGDLDYKSISKLYEMEDRFDDEYRSIMGLFRESNVVTKTAINYYFSLKDGNGVWRRVEPSFCRL